MKLMILFCLVLLGRLGTAATTHLLIEGDDVPVMYFHESEYRLLGNVKDMAEHCEDHKKMEKFVTQTDTDNQINVEKVEVCVLNWNALDKQKEHMYVPDSPVSKMFYFLKNVAPIYNDCGKFKYALSTPEEKANEDIHSTHQVYDADANEECGKIGLQRPLPVQGFSAMNVRIMKTREEMLKNINKNFPNKYDKLEAAEKQKYVDKATAIKNEEEEVEAKKAKMTLEDWRKEKSLDTKTALQFFKEEQEAAFAKLLDKENLTVGEIHKIEIASGLAPRQYRNEDQVVKGDTEMETNPYYGHQNKVKDVILEYFRFQIRDIAKGKAHVEKMRKETTDELMWEAKELLRESYPDKTEEQLEKEASEETNAHVSGCYGHVNLPVNDCQLNEPKIDGQDIAFESSINSPRSLVRMLNVANHYNFQMLLDFSAAKLASVIADNDLYRTRVMLGMDKLGDYTYESYIDTNDNRVCGIKELEVKNPWFDRDSKTEKYHHSKRGETSSLQGIADFDGKCYNALVFDGKECTDWKLTKENYKVNDHKVADIKFWATEDGKDIPPEKL